MRSSSHNESAKEGKDIIRPVLHTFDFPGFPGGKFEVRHGDVARVNGILGRVHASSLSKYTTLVFSDFDDISAGRDHEVEVRRRPGMYSDLDAMGSSGDPVLSYITVLPSETAFDYAQNIRLKCPQCGTLVKPEGHSSRCGVVQGNTSATTQTIRGMAWLGGASHLSDVRTAILVKSAGADMTDQSVAAYTSVAARAEYVTTYFAPVYTSMPFPPVGFSESQLASAFNASYMCPHFRGLYMSRIFPDIWTGMLHCGADFEYAEHFSDHPGTEGWQILRRMGVIGVLTPAGTSTVASRRSGTPSSSGV